MRKISILQHSCQFLFFLIWHQCFEERLKSFKLLTVGFICLKLITLIIQAAMKHITCVLKNIKKATYNVNLLVLVLDSFNNI